MNKSGMSLGKRLSILLGGSLFLGTLNLKLFLTRHPTHQKDFSRTRPFRWNWFRLGGRTSTANGRPFSLMTRKGTSNNLILFFSGGGSAWDGRTALQPMGLGNLAAGKGFGYYFSHVAYYILGLLNGILDHKNPLNPFKDWHAVHIPYATGDFHTGCGSTEYEDEGKRKTLFHYGRQNVLKSLEWLTGAIKKPERILVCGESAGAFGSAFWTPYIRSLYPDSRLYYLADGAFLKYEKWPEVFDRAWKADFEKTFGYCPGEDPIKSAFLYNASSLGESIPLLHANTLYDGILSAFQADMNGHARKDELERNPEKHRPFVQEWSREMVETTKTLSESIPNYYYYLTDYSYDEKKGTTTHTLLRYDHFYKCREGGVAYYEWLAHIVLEDKRYSVGKSRVESCQDIGQTPHPLS